MGQILKSNKQGSLPNFMWCLSVLCGVPSQAYSLNRASLQPSQGAPSGNHNVVVKQIKSADRILFSDLYQEHNSVHCFHCLVETGGKLDYTCSGNTWPVCAKYMCTGGMPERRDERWAGGWGEGQPRKSQDSASGQYCQVRWMMIDVGFYSAFDKPPNRNPKNNGDWGFFITYI